MIWWIAMAILGWTCTAMMTYVSYRFYRKAVVYDVIFKVINDDLIANIKQFAKMAHSPVLGNDAEIQEAHRLMMIMGKRFNEVSLQMEEATGLALRPPPPLPRPKIHD
jgi:hypothetical protein